jgi:chromate reductase
MGCSGGAVGTARMQYHLRQTMVFLNMFPLNRPEVMINNCVGKFDEQGRLSDEKTREYLREALEALVHWTRRLRS